MTTPEPTAPATEEAATPVEGVLNFFSESGTEGGWYYWQDRRFIHTADEPCFDPATGPGHCPVRDGHWHEHWKYEGLRQLHNGDHLVIFDGPPRTDTGAVVWEGDVGLQLRNDVYQVNEDGTAPATVFGMWVNQEPDPALGVDRETWAKWFLEGYRCTVLAATTPT